MIIQLLKLASSFTKAGNGLILDFFTDLRSSILLVCNKIYSGILLVLDLYLSYLVAITIQSFLYFWVLTLAGPLASFAVMFGVSLAASYWYHNNRYKTMPLNYPKIFETFMRFNLGKGALTSYMLAFSIFFGHTFIRIEDLFFLYYFIAGVINYVLLFTGLDGHTNDSSFDRPTFSFESTVQSFF